MVCKAGNCKRGGYRDAKVTTMKKLIRTGGYARAGRAAGPDRLSPPLSNSGQTAVAGLTPSGIVNMDQVQWWPISVAAGGSGTLYTTRVLPIHSRSAALASAASARPQSALRGEVYKLSNPGNFPGTPMARLATASRSAKMSGGDL